MCMEEELVTCEVAAARRLGQRASALQMRSKKHISQLWTTVASNIHGHTSNSSHKNVLRNMFP